MKNPEKLALAQSEMLNDELRIYNPRQEQVYVLNPTSALVWEHCDGQTDQAALSVLLQRQLGLPSDVADELLWLTLDQLEKADLLQEPITAPRHVYSRRQVIKIMAIMGLSAALAPLASPVKAQGTLPYRIFMPDVQNELTTSSSTSSSSSSTPTTSSTSSSSSSTPTTSSTSSSTSTMPTTTTSTSTED